MNKKLIKFGTQLALVTYIPVIDKLISPIINQMPYWSATWMAAIGLYNLYLYVEQDKVNEVIEFIKENPDKFTEKVVTSEYFRSNFLKFLGEYLKQYNKNKREALKKVLLDYLSEDEKDRYEIDRFNNILSQISLEAMQNLLWIHDEILPIVNEDIKKELLQYKADDEREINRLKDVTKARKNVSNYVHTWITNNYGPNSDKVKKMNGYKEDWTEEEKKHFNQEQWIKEHEIDKTKNSHWAEYTSLGIMTPITESSGFSGSSGNVYKLTDFGEKFIKYLKIEDR